MNFLLNIDLIYLTEMYIIKFFVIIKFLIYRKLCSKIDEVAPDNVTAIEGLNLTIDAGNNKL